MKTRFWAWIVLLVVGLSWQACPPVGGANSARSQTDSLALTKALHLKDWVYEPYIKTVQLYRGENPFSYPILYLGEETQLTLEFDALQSPELEAEDYWIDAISCDHDWQPSGLLPLEFIEGFSTDRMYFNMRSQNTLIPYVHYRYQFPAENAQFKKSGNYLLRVYRAGNEADLILTKRLVVADHKIIVLPKMGLARMASDRRKIQRVDFALQFATQFPGILDPRTDLHVYILQNFRWDNAVGGLQPLFIAPEELDYSFDAANNFEGGNEYRMVDLRSTRFRTNTVEKIENEDSVVRYTLLPDAPRLYNQYYSRQDLNGNYVVQVQEYPNAAYESDYVFVRFAMKWGEPLKDTRVYLHGKFNDWRQEPENELFYNALSGRYECELLLKQGVYDYAYVAQNIGTDKLDEAKFEGSHAETENYYTILVYYKPIGARSAELVGMSHVNYYDR